MPKYTKLLTPHEYEKLTLDEKAEYITAMATVLKSRIPERDSSTPDQNNQAQDDPQPQVAASQAQEDPPAPAATNQAQDDPSRSVDKPQEPRPNMAPRKS